MPYQRRQSRRNRRPRRQYASQGGGYLDTASKALAVAFAVKKLINVEYMSFRVTPTSDPNTSGTSQNMTAIAQGDDTSDRQGDKIRVKRLALSGIVTLHASATDSRVRFVIVRDNNGSTTIPTIANLYAGASAFADNTLKSGTPQENSRFSVLWDKMVIVNSDTPTKAFSYSMTLDHHVFFSGPAATDEGKGHLYLFMASNEATNDPVVTAKTQVWYLDN